MYMLIFPPHHNPRLTDGLSVLAHYGRWFTVQWSIADLLTSNHPQMSASHLLGVQVYHPFWWLPNILAALRIQTLVFIRQKGSLYKNLKKIVPMKTESYARATLCYVVLSIMPSRLPWELLHHNLKNQGPAFSHCTVMQSERFSPIQLRFCNQIRVSFQRMK